MTRVREDLVVTLGFAACATFFLVQSAGLSRVARTAPVLVAVPTLVLCAIELARQWRRPAVAGKGSPGLHRRETRMLAWMAGLLVCLDLLGTLGGLPMFLFLYLRWQARESWAVSIAVPVVLGGLLFGMLAGVVRAPIDAGRLAGWIGVA